MEKVVYFSCTPPVSSQVKLVIIAGFFCYACLWEIAGKKNPPGRVWVIGSGTLIIFLLFFSFLWVGYPVADRCFFECDPEN